MLKQHSDRERKKGTADLLVLALLAERRRHGYEIAKLISERSGGTLRMRRIRANQLDSYTTTRKMSDGLKARPVAPIASLLTV